MCDEGVSDLRTCRESGSNDGSEDHYDAVLSEVKYAKALSKIYRGERLTDGFDDEPLAESSLDKKLQQVFSKITNVKEMARHAVKFGYDVRKLPFEELTRERINYGYRYLGRLEGHINERYFDNRFREALDDYYGCIPHDFRRKKPTEVKTKDDIKKELKLLGYLSDAHTVLWAIEEGHKLSPKLHPLDRFYAVVQRQLTPLQESDPMYSLIQRYLGQSQGRDLEMFEEFDLEIVNIFETDSVAERENFNGSLGKRQLLWHGSRLTNWYGMLLRGLQVAPEEHPHDGYSFGRGLYFANVASNSALYSQSDKPYGFLALVEVALGDSLVLLAPDYNAPKKLGRNTSVFGRGWIVPDPEKNEVIEDGLVVPFGELIELKDEDARKTKLTYDEFVVYDPSQARMRYLVEVNFINPKRVKSE
ncbi:poly (ADP-ribose) polymerase 2 [Aphelenchoides avenae]|nr:poly (ADP-ribose) polymerase 2 [Aphelenchus avenae]